MKKPPPPKNDCFALPQGTNWTPVDEALRHLRLASKCLVGTEKLSAVSAAGRGISMDKEEARELFYGMTMQEWKSKYQTSPQKNL